MTKHTEIRKKLMEIPLVQDFNALLDRCTISDTDKEILRMHYNQNLTFGEIGERMGYSDTTLRRRHQKALGKIYYALKSV